MGDYAADLAEAELRAYHEAYSVALVDVVTEVVRMDADGWGDRGALVSKAAVEDVLRTMVSDHGIVGQALVEAEQLTTTALRERDAARDIAARLEGECARLEAALREVVTVLGEHGEANHPAQLCALMALGEWDPDAVIAEGES